MRVWREGGTIGTIVVHRGIVTGERTVLSNLERYLVDLQYYSRHCAVPVVRVRGCIPEFLTAQCAQSSQGGSRRKDPTVGRMFRTQRTMVRRPGIKERNATGF